MPTEEDLKAIVVHKKYSSSRKSKGESSRKRKRTTSSDSSHSSISSGNDHKSDIKQEAKVNPDVGFIPSRFLKDKSQRRSSSRRREEDSLVSYPGYKESKRSRDGREEGKRDRSISDRRDERRDDRRDDRREDSRNDRRDDRRDDRREERREDRRDDRRDDRRHEDEDRGRRDRDHDSRRDDRSRVEDDTRRSRADEVSSRSKYDSHSKSFSGQRKDSDQYRHRRDDENRRKPRDEHDRLSAKRSSSMDSNKRKSMRDEDEDYDPISDEELAMLEEDAGILEIYKELEREIRSKRYTANLEGVDFSALDILKPEKPTSEPTVKDPMDRLLKCGYSSNYGGKAITEKIKALSLQKGVEAPLNGAFSANKLTLRKVFQDTLSPHIALSSHTDLMLRQKLAQLDRDKNVSQIVLTDEPVNNTLLTDSVKLFNSMAGTNLEVK